jgi:hypothetical protein
MKLPYVGAIVQYRYRPQDSPLAAIITYVHDEKWVSLRVFHPGGRDESPSHVECDAGWKWPADPNSWGSCSGI